MLSMLGDREDKTESCSFGERVNEEIIYSMSRKDCSFESLKS